jgi:hypothetical protein
MTKLSITIHSTDDPILALIRCFTGLDSFNISLLEHDQINFSEAGNLIMTVELIPEVWNDD